METGKSVLSSIVGVFTFLLVVGLGRAYPGVSIVIFLACISVWAGFAYGQWYLKKEHINEGWLSFLFWSNLLVWLLPPLGMFTGTATYVINSENNGEDRGKYIFLAWFGIVLSLVNGVMGAVLATKR